MTTPEARPSPARERRGRGWVVLAGVEVAVGTTAVLADVGIPTLTMLLVAVASVALRREGLRSLGLHRVPALPLVGRMTLFAVLWTLFQLWVTIPVASHLSGREQDLGDFAELEGNLGMLVVLLLLSWTLAAFGEELAYRGWLQTRMRELLGGGRAALVVAVVASSLLFGLAHIEQGPVGVAVVAVDGVAFSWLRYRYGTLWAPVLAHGLNNTIGFVAFFLLGPVHGIW